MKYIIVVIALCFFSGLASSHEFKISKNSKGDITKITECVAAGNKERKQVNSWELKTLTPNLPGQELQLHWNCNEGGRLSTSTISPADYRMMKFIIDNYVCERKLTPSEMWKLMFSGKWLQDKKNGQPIHKAENNQNTPSK